jgi:hypothetical protein
MFSKLDGLSAKVIMQRAYVLQHPLSVASCKLHAARHGVRRLYAHLTPDTAHLEWPLVLQLSVACADVLARTARDPSLSQPATEALCGSIHTQLDSPSAGGQQPQASQQG